MPRILVIDDDTTMREMLYDALSRKGYQVTTASTGEQAMEVMKTMRPEAILLDVRMPGWSGLQTAERIREFDDGVPIILMHGPGDPEVTQAERTRAGIAEVIRKELGVELFLSTTDLAIKRLQPHESDKDVAAAFGVNGTLLITDDDAQVRRLLQEFFETRGLRVLTAGSGEEALKAMGSHPNAVILDMNMPGMDGLMTLRKLRAAQPNLPVIMATGVDDESVVREAMASGAYDYITKPFNLEYLETVVLTKVLLGMDH